MYQQHTALIKNESTVKALSFEYGDVLVMYKPTSFLFAHVCERYLSHDAACIIIHAETKKKKDYASKRYNAIILFTTLATKS